MSFSLFRSLLRQASASLPLLAAQMTHQRLSQQVAWCPQDAVHRGVALPVAVGLQFGGPLQLTIQ